MMRKRHTGLILLLGLLLSVSFAAAQEPTPFSPIVPQGNPNTGQVQPFALSDVAVRTGITPWLEAGWTGTGVRVGVLDRGFGGLLAFEQTFGSDVTVATGGTDAAYDANPITHGTQVLEVLHRTAPGAELYACEYDTLDTFNLCIDYMISVGVRVINHSAGVPALPLDGTNPWALQVDRAAQRDILWVQSAGNFAQGFVRDFLTYSDTMNPVHEFRGRGGIEPALAVNPVSATATGVVMLSWEDHNGRAANTYDLDLYIFDPNTGEPIGGSSRTQAGMPGDEALEYDRIPMNRPFAIQVRDNTGEAFGIPFALYVEFAQVPNGAADRSIIAPGDSGSALTVGALQGFRIAPYSSRGPVGEGVVKPDIAAPGEVQLADGTQFIGTSAAAPVIAGGAALLLEAEPELSLAGLRNQLLAAVQDDDQFPGIDTNYGRGRVYLPGVPFAPTVVAVVPTVTPAPSELIPAPTEVAAFPELGMSLVNPVTSNAQWTPTERDFDGATMVLVPAGCFMMGSVNGGNNEKPSHEICIERPYWLDKYEVTNAQYGSTGDSEGELFPRDSVSWFNAADHCAARGGRLPTEPEWEYAASGPDDLVFPWGNEWNPDNLVWGGTEIFGQRSFAVGSFDGGVSWVGAHDMSGNLQEWTSTIYAGYPYSADQENLNNIQSNRVVRGGSFFLSRDGLFRIARRDQLRPTREFNTTGFRCARSR